MDDFPTNAMWLSDVQKDHVQETCDDLRTNGASGWLVVGDPKNSKSDAVGVYELKNLPDGYGVNAQAELVKLPEGKAIGQYANHESWV